MQIEKIPEMINDEISKINKNKEITDKKLKLLKEKIELLNKEKSDYENKLEELSELYSEAVDNNKKHENYIFELEENIKNLNLNEINKDIISELDIKYKIEIDEYKNMIIKKDENNEILLNSKITLENSVKDLKKHIETLYNQMQKDSENIIITKLEFPLEDTKDLNNQKTLIGKDLYVIKNKIDLGKKEDIQNLQENTNLIDNNSDELKEQIKILENQALKNNKIIEELKKYLDLNLKDLNENYILKKDLDKQLYELNIKNEGDLSKLRNEISILTNNLKNEKEIYKKLLKENQEFSSKIEEMEKIKIELDEKINKISQLEYELVKLLNVEENNSTNQKIIQELESKINNLNELIFEKEKDLENLNLQFSDSENKCKNFIIENKEILINQSKIEVYHNGQIEEKKNIIDNLTGNVQNLTEHCEKILQENNLNKINFEKEISGLNREQKKLNLENKNIKNDIEIYIKEIEFLKNSLNSHQDKNEKDKENMIILENQNKEISDLNHKLICKDEEYNEIVKKYQKILNENEDKDYRISELESLKIENNTNINNLINDLQKEKNKNIKKSEIFERLQEEKILIEKKYEFLLDEKLKISENLEKLNKENSELIKKLEISKNEYSQILEKFKNLQIAKETITNQFIEAQELLNEKDIEIKNLEDDKSNINFLIDENENYKEEILKKNEIIKDLNLEVQKNKNKSEEILNQRIKMINEEKTSLIDKLKEVNESLLNNKKAEFEEILDKKNNTIKDLKSKILEQQTIL